MKVNSKKVSAKIMDFAIESYVNVKSINFCKDDGKLVMILLRICVSAEFLNKLEREFKDDRVMVACGDEYVSVFVRINNLDYVL